MEKILIVDDEKHMRVILSKILKDERFETLQAENAHQAILEVERNKPDLVLLDYKLPDMNGNKVLEKIKQIDESLIVIMLTAFGDIKKAVNTMKLGAYDYLTKPFNNDEIILVIRKALQTLHLKREVKSLKKELGKEHEMIGESKQIKQILEQIELVAPNDITVFLEGETGTGKELVARLIHKKSPRANNPFVAVDCGAIPEALFESEMFGHEKGAFTGAINTRIGKFEQANQGTLFLDEISNLPLSMQAKLLRAIQNKQIIRLGGKQNIDVDVRIIAASNINIVENIESGKFRNDLFYRIHEFKIELPALKNRKDDIPLLADHFLKNMNLEFNKNIQGFSIDAIDSMLNYEWKGNIRELKNVIKRAVLIAKTDYISAEHLLFTNIGNPEKKISSNQESSFENVSKEALQAKVDILKKAIQKAGGNKTKAAKNLGITRNQMYRTLKRFEE